MKKFGKGIIAGIAVSIGAATAGIIAIKKKIIDPVKQKEQKVTENRKKATRKRITR